jgi:hypothetical protein
LAVVLSVIGLLASNYYPFLLAVALSVITNWQYNGQKKRVIIRSQ